MSVWEARIILLQIYRYFYHLLCANYLPKLLCFAPEYSMLKKNLKLCHSIMSLRTLWPQCKLLQSCEESKFRSSHSTVKSAVSQVLINQT